MPYAEAWRVPLMHEEFGCRKSGPVIRKRPFDARRLTVDGSTTHLKAGDVVVQRGTVHNWVNRGTEPCVIAFVLIAAKPVEIGGKVLQAFG